MAYGMLSHLPPHPPHPTPRLLFPEVCKAGKTAPDILSRKNLESGVKYIRKQDTAISDHLRKNICIHFTNEIAWLSKDGVCSTCMACIYLLAALSFFHLLILSSFKLLRTFKLCASKNWLLFFFPRGKFPL